MNKFSENLDLVVKNLGSESCCIFGKNETNNINGKVEKSKTHLLESIEMTDWSSSFPVRLLLSIDGISQEDQNHFIANGSGKGGVAIINSLSSGTNENRTLITGAELTGGEDFLKRFRGYHAENLEKDISYRKNPKFNKNSKSSKNKQPEQIAYVPDDNPVMAAFFEVRQLEEKQGEKQTEGKRFKLEKLPGDVYALDPIDVNYCLMHLKNKLQKSIPLMNVSDLSFRISRGVNGENESEVWKSKQDLQEKFISSSGVKNALEIPYTLSATFKISFRDIASSSSSN